MEEETYEEFRAVGNGGDEYGREMKKLLRSLKVMTESSREGSRSSSVRRQQGQQQQQLQVHLDPLHARKRFLTRNNIRPDFFCQHKLLAEFGRPVAVEQQQQQQDGGQSKFVVGSRLAPGSRSSERAAKKMSLPQQQVQQQVQLPQQVPMPQQVKVQKQLPVHRSSLQHPAIIAGNGAGTGGGVIIKKGRTIRKRSESPLSIQEVFSASQILLLLRHLT